MVLMSTQKTSALPQEANKDNSTPTQKPKIVLAGIGEGIHAWGTHFFDTRNLTFEYAQQLIEEGYPHLKIES